VPKTRFLLSFFCQAFFAFSTWFLYLVFARSNMYMPGFMLTLRMLNSYLHTVCYALNDSIQQAVGLRGSALEHVHAWRSALGLSCQE